MEVDVRGNRDSRKHAVRLFQTNAVSHYVTAVLFGYPALFFPLAFYIGYETLLYVEIVSITMVILMFWERRHPGSLLNFIVALPSYLLASIYYFVALFTVTASGEMGYFYVFLAIVSGIGKLLADSIVIRKLPPERVITSLIEGRRVTMSDRGLVVTIPWASDLFTQFSRWESVAIWSVRTILFTSWAWAFFRYGPGMYSSTGILDRLPHVIALAGFPMAFFVCPLWQMPFMYYCNKYSERLVDAAEKQRRRDEKAKQYGDNEAPEWKWL